MLSDVEATVGVLSDGGLGDGLGEALRVLLVKSQQDATSIAKSTEETL